MAKRKKSSEDGWDGKGSLKCLNNIFKFVESAQSPKHREDFRYVIKDLLNCKMFELNDDVVIKMIEETEPIFEGKRLPYPDIFIDVEMRVTMGDLVVLSYGMMVSEFDIEDDEKFKQFSESDMILIRERLGDGKFLKFRVHGGIIMNDHPMSRYFKGTMIDIKRDKVTPNLVRFSNVMPVIVPGYDKLEGVLDVFYEEAQIDQEYKDMIHKMNEQLALDIVNFTMNFIDFINQSDIEIVNAERVRVERPKTKIRKETILTNVVTIKGKLREHVDKIRRGENIHYSHRFWVRGHWRDLKSNKYVNAQGKRVWIKPYVKGSGILVNKIYQVEE